MTQAAQQLRPQYRARHHQVKLRQLTHLQLKSPREMLRHSTQTVTALCSSHSQSPDRPMTAPTTRHSLMASRHSLQAMVCPIQSSWTRLKPTRLQPRWTTWLSRMLTSLPLELAKLLDLWPTSPRSTRTSSGTATVVLDLPICPVWRRHSTTQHRSATQLVTPQACCSRPLVTTRLRSLVAAT